MQGLDSLFSGHSTLLLYVVMICCPLLMNICQVGGWAPLPQHLSRGGAQQLAAAAAAARRRTLPSPPAQAMPQLGRRIASSSLDGCVNCCRTACACCLAGSCARPGAEVAPGRRWGQRDGAGKARGSGSGGGARSIAAGARQRAQRPCVIWGAAQLRWCCSRCTRAHHTVLLDQTLLTQLPGPCPFPCGDFH